MAQANRSVANRLVGWLGWIWGVGGILALLSYAIFRLSEQAWQALSGPMNALHWTVLIVNVLFMAYSEGYRGFQIAFSPRAAARAKHVLHHPSALMVIAAPFFCMGYFNTTRRRLIVAYSLTLGIVALVAMFRLLDQPWRGVLDAGVVVGLLWGSISLTCSAIAAVFSPGYRVSPELGEPRAA